MRAHFHLAILCGLLTLLGGCAVRSSNLMPAMETTPNPQQGTAVRIETVQDFRHFQIKPETADIPSLQEGDINDGKLTDRTIGRKRNGFGMALANVFLPEGQTVSSLVKEATAQGFREAGYRVLTEKDSGYQQALPIRAKINQFWEWGHQDGISIAISYRSEIQLDGTLPPLSDPSAVWGNAKISSLIAITESDWKDLADKGLADYIHNLRDRLRGTPPKS